MFIIHKRERLSPDEGISGSPRTHSFDFLNQLSEMASSSPLGRLFHHE
jgi:hypothetical protein